jgi:WD40 repeat protein
LFSFSGTQPYLSALALSQDKRWLASSGSDWRIRIWDAQSRQLLREIDEFGATHLVFSPDGHYLVGNGGESSDGKTISHTEIAIWEVDTGEIIRYFDLVGSEIAFHPNGVQILSARGDGQIQLLDLRSGQPVWVTTDPKPIFSPAFSPDGSILAALYHKTIRFLDAKTGELLTEIPLTFAPSSLVFSPDGKTLAIGADGTIRLFRIK